MLVCLCMVYQIGIGLCVSVFCMVYQIGIGLCVTVLVYGISDWNMFVC